MTVIHAAKARSVWDSRGRPTIEVEITTAAGTACAIAPAGASRGEREAHELRDADHLGVDIACATFDREIAPCLLGMAVDAQTTIDARLIAIDGTETRGRLGANTLIATSMAVAHAAARANGLPLYQWLLADRKLPALPMPEIQILGGGAHAERRIDLQDLMVVPVGADDWPTALRWCAAVYRAARALLDASHSLRGVADEGGFFPNVGGDAAALELLTRAIDHAGYRPGDQLVISLDVAASQFYTPHGYLPAGAAQALASSEWIERLVGWCRCYPIRLVEDPADQNDLGGFQAFRHALPSCRVVGDDLVTTRAEDIRAAARCGAIDAALIKPNQVGTLSEAKSAFDACLASNVMPIVSARSGETEDVTIAHLATGWGAAMLKVGSIARGERTAKWNEMLRISEALGHPPLHPIY